MAGGKWIPSFPTVRVYLVRVHIELSERHSDLVYVTMESPLMVSFAASSRFQVLLQDNDARSKLPGKSSGRSVNTIGKSKLRYSMRGSFYYIKFMRTYHILNLHLLFFIKGY